MTLQHQTKPLPVVAIALVVCFLLALSPVSAGIVFVDNSTGSDALDGRVPVPSSGNAGPVRTISRALELARTGDNIEIKNTGKPYYESLTLFGARHSGFATLPSTSGWRRRPPGSKPASRRSGACSGSARC